MNILQKAHYITPEEYLAKEVEELERHEYFEGKITQIRPKSILEVRIVMNVFMSVSGCLQSETADLFNSNLRMHNQQNTFFTYPDVSIYHRPITTYNNRDDVTTNPSVILNLMPHDFVIYESKNKFLLHHQIPSLKEYIAFSSSGILVGKYTRLTGDEWQFKVYDQIEQSFEIESVGILVRLGQFYQDIGFKRDNYID